MAVSAGTAYLQVAPQLVKDFSKQIAAAMAKPAAAAGEQAGSQAGRAMGDAASRAMAAPMARAADQTGDTTGRRLGGRIGAGLKASSALMLAPLAALGPAVAAALGGAAIIGGTKSLLDAATNVGEAMNKTRVIFRGSANDIIAWSKTSATAMGLSQREALASASSFGDMFLQLKLGRGPATDMSKKMVELASDFASFHNVDITEVLEAQSGAFRGEYDSIQRFIPAISDARVKQEALRLSHKKSEKDLTDAEKAMAVYQIMLKDTASAQGDFARTSGDAANRQRTVRAQFEDLKATLGNGLLPVWNAVLGFVINKFMPAMGKLAPVFRTIGLGVKALAAAFREGDVTSDGFVGVMERVGVVLRGVWDWLTRVGRVAAGILIPAVKGIVEAVRPAIAAFVSGLVPGLRMLAQVVAERVWPILKVVAAVIGGVLYLALAKVIPFVLRLAGPVLGFLARNLSVTIGWITNIIRWIGLLGAGFLRWITGTQNTGDAIRELGRRVGVFATNMRREWDRIVAQVTGAVGKVRSVWSTGWAAIRDFVARIWPVIRMRVATGINGVIGLINSFIRGVERIAGRLGLSINLPEIGLVSSGDFGGRARPGGMQQGGVVPGSGTGDKVLVLTEPGEIVIPNRRHDRQRLLRNPQVAARLGLDVGGDAGMIRLLGFQTGGIIPRVQQWIRRQDPKPYVWGGAGPGSFDCSGLVGAVYGMLTGKGGGSGQRYFTTATIGPAQGFRAGRGTFTVGVTPGRGHMAGNLAGLGFEARSSRTGIFVGNAARSVTSFARQFYLPQVGNRFIAGGGGFAALLATLLRPLLGPIRAGLARLGGAGAISQLAAGAGNKLLSAGVDWLQGRVADTGAVLTPGWNALYNATGALERLVPAGAGAGAVINVYAAPGMSERQLARLVAAEFDERDRRTRAGARR